MIRFLVALAMALWVTPAAAQQGNWLNGVYTLAAGPDNIYTNLPPAAYCYHVAWVSDRPVSAGFMVSDCTQWISDQGTAGKTVLSGSGAPSSGTGANGDFYIDTSASRIYGPKASGAWGSGTSMIGPQGSAGTNGTNGANGSAATVSVGTVTTLAPGASATVTNAGSSNSAVFNFGIPAGAAGSNGSNGATGSPGAAATVAVGSVSALPAGSTPTVTNVGSSSAAVLNFGLTVGNAGADGAAGVNAFGSPSSRSLSLATAYQATTTAKPAVVTVNLSSTASLSLTGGTSNTADVVIGSTNAVASGTGTLICRYANTNTGALTVGLALSTTAASTCTFALPAGWYFAVRQTAGTITITSAFDQVVG